MSFQKIAVVGAGIMGTGIAIHFSGQNIEVLLYDSDDDQRNRASENLKDANVQLVSNLDDLAECDFVLEAIFENLPAKQQLLTRLSAVVDQQCILATNTSSLLVSDMADSASHPNRFIGVHFNNPADFNPIVEVIGTQHSDPEVITRVAEWITQTGKTAIRCADTPCFVLNRQSLPYLNEAARCLDIATPGEVDLVATEKLGVGLGPFAVMNLVGLPVLKAASINLSVLGRGYASAEQLQQQSEPWQIQATSVVPKDRVTRIVQRLRGAMIFPGKDILDQQLCSRDDLHRICVEALGYEKSSAEWLEILTPTVQAELIEKFLTNQSA